MEQKTELPMGIENFARIRKDGFYYVDKTGLIRDLLENRAYVNLFTRPRRFGDSLAFYCNIAADPEKKTQV